MRRSNHRATAHTLPARLAVAAALLAPAARAHAQQTPTATTTGAPTAGDTEARARFDRGVQLMGIQDYGGALAEFQAAYELSHRPTILYNIGVAHQALHHYPEAARNIEQYLREATLTPERRAEVERGLAEIQQFIAHVTLAGLPDGASVTLDGQPLGRAPFAAPVAISTGEHTLEASADGFRDARTTFLIAGGQSREVRVDMEPAAAAGAAAASTGAIALRAVPRGARVAVDGRAVDPGQPVVLPAGAHELAVSGPGLAPGRARVGVLAGVTRVATVRPARAGGLPLVLPVITGLATVALAAGAGVAGGLALGDYSQFQMLNQMSPNVADVSARGSAERDAANAMLIGAGVTGAATVVLLLFTHWGPPNTTIDVALGGGGASGTVTARF